MTDFNDTTCKNPNQFIIDLANDHIDSMNLLNGKICAVEEQSILRDNQIVAGVDVIATAVSELQSAVHATPEQIAALASLIDDNVDSLNGLAAQAAANASVAAANGTLVAANEALIVQLNTAQADAATARQALAELVTQLTARVTATEVSLVSHDARITTLENATPVDSTDGITAAQLAAAVEAAKCEVYTSVADSMAQASVIMKSYAPAACVSSVSFSPIDTSGVTGAGAPVVDGADSIEDPAVDTGGIG